MDEGIEAEGKVEVGLASIIYYSVLCKTCSRSLKEGMA